MKKYIVILGALLALTGSAFAQSTWSNDDSCDITVSPAATLLLPYFSVDPSGAGETTLVTVTNVSDAPAVAHVTVWTNLSWPVLDFNLFLTGYDVQGFSLTDVLVNGTIVSTSTASNEGSRSLDNDTGNPFGVWAVSGRCDAPQGGTIPDTVLLGIQSALLGGENGAYCDRNVGLATETYVGYITIDIVNDCTQNLPSAGIAYWNNEVLFDNVLIGDYIRLEADGSTAGASPLVHIKAVPPGGDVYATAAGTTAFFNTFYERFQDVNNQSIDRRQPLPAQWAARYLYPGNAFNFDTDFVVWRQGASNGLPACTAAWLGGNNARYIEIVRFDEAENPATFQPDDCVISPCTTPGVRRLAETQVVNVANVGSVNGPHIPTFTTNNVRNGWVYMNLAVPAADIADELEASQSWVTVRMTAPGRGVDFDAAYLANGCTVQKALTAPSTGGIGKIGPGQVQTYKMVD